ncbi:hypothetical protein G6F68_019332 [Rhizopus microsporus]|nr:hypothetical protein G6F68_019332 [Rhizopus microsporus]
MSSEDEDIDLNDDTTSQIETITDDGGEAMDIEDPLPSTRNSPASPPRQLSDADTRQVDLNINPQRLTCSSYDCVPYVSKNANKK